MSISKKLLTLVITVLVVMAGIGSMTVWQVEAGKQVTAMLHEETMPELETIGNIRYEFVKLRMLAYRHLSVQDVQLKEEVEKNMGEVKASLKTHFEEYKKMTQDPEDLKRLAVTETALIQEYFPVYDKVTSLSHAGDMDGAMKYVNEVFPALGKKVESSLSDLVKYDNDRADNYVEQALLKASSAEIAVIVIIVLLVLVFAGWGIWLYKSITGPLNLMKEAISHIVSNLDFRNRIPVQSNDETGQTITAFNSLITKLQSSFREIKDHTETVAAASYQMAAAAEQVSTSSMQQSDAASAMAASMEEMAVSIQQVGDRASDANQLATASGNVAKAGETVILQTVGDINNISIVVKSAAGHIEELQAASNNISSVINVIREVADQTNLLALNAAIEAARAGEQGRGFAVVADEVRKLAERTAGATQEISKTIQSMHQTAQEAVGSMHDAVNKVDQGVTRAKEANQTIATIEESSQQTVRNVEDIASAIREQSAASNSIAQQVERIAQMTEENHAAAEETNDAAGSLHQLASELKTITAQYQV